MPTRPLPHDPYANAVMAALNAEGLLDAANSWTAYDCDNGEVMMMETVINLDPDRARAAGYDHGVTLLWNHTRSGWEYGPAQHGGHLQYVADLITGAPVADPTHIVRAAQILLDPADNLAALPIAGATRPPAQTIPPATPGRPGRRRSGRGHGPRPVRLRLTHGPRTAGSLPAGRPRRPHPAGASA